MGPRPWISHLIPLLPLSWLGFVILAGEQKTTQSAVQLLFSRANSNPTRVYAIVMQN